MWRHFTTTTPVYNTPTLYYSAVGTSGPFSIRLRPTTYRVASETARLEVTTAIPQIYGNTASYGTTHIVEGASELPKLQLEGHIDTPAAVVKSFTPVITGALAASNANTTFTRTAAGAGWDAQAYSVESYTSNCYATAMAASLASKTVFGLNSDPATNANFTGIDYAWNMASDNNAYIYESNVGIGSQGAYTTSTVLAITYDGTNICYLKDGVAVRTVARAVGSALFFDSSFNTSAGALTSVEFGQYAPRSSVLLDGQPASYGDIIAAALEGRAGSVPGAAVNPDYFLDPFGRKFSYPRVVAFTAQYIQGVPYRQNFSMTLQLTRGSTS